MDYYSKKFIKITVSAIYDGKFNDLHMRLQTIIFFELYCLNIEDKLCNISIKCL